MEGTRMTAIAALVEGASVYIGTDSAGVCEYRLYCEKAGKVFKTGSLLIAYTESFRMGQLLQYGTTGVKKLSSLTPPKTERTAFKFMVNEVVPVIRRTLKLGGCMKINLTSEEEISGILVAWKHFLFSVDIDLAVHEYREPYTASGCAEHCILGSFYTTEKLKRKVSPEQRVLLALEAADRHYTAVSPPFHIMKT